MQVPYVAPFETIVSARFIERPNRFIVHGQLASGDVIRAFLPNPGRLQELLLPDVTIYVVPEPADSTRKTKFTMIGVAGASGPIFLHTHVNNDVARHLLSHDLVPGLEGATIVRAEVPHGNSRFDFLLEQEGASIYVEVKSCTLFGNGVAMFPDAVTARGRRHLEELAELADRGTRCVVLFVVHSGDVRCFMPDFHTDLDFSKTLLAVRDRVAILPMAVQWNPDFRILRTPALLPIPWDYVAGEAEDRGNYLIIFEVAGGQATEPGVHVVIGWQERELRKFLRLFKTRARKLGGVIAQLHADAQGIEYLPIVSSVNRAEAIRDAVEELSGGPGSRGKGQVEGDHYTVHFCTDIRKEMAFHDFLARFRMALPPLD